MYSLAKKLLTGLIVLLMVCLSACGKTANESGNESTDSAETEEDGISVSAALSTEINSTESDISLPDDYVPLYLEENELKLISAQKAGDINIYTYSLDNFGWREKNMLFCSESDDIDSGYIAYALDGSSLVKAEKESFEFALSYDRFYSLDTVLPDEAYVVTMVMDWYRYKDQELYYYIDNGNDMGFSPIKINEEKLLIYHHGMGWPIDYYEYGLSDGTIRDILRELGTPEESVLEAAFSGDAGSMLFSCCEANGNTVYYYADLDKNEYINVEDVFDIEMNYVFSDKYASIQTAEFIWAGADTYMIIVMTDNGYSIYKCDFDEKNMELVSSGLKMAYAVKCGDGKHGDCILTIDAEGRIEVYRPAENKTAVLEGDADTLGYTSYIGCCEYDDIIAFGKNGPDALYIDWDKGITSIGDTNIRSSNFLRDGDNIYVFQK